MSSSPRPSRVRFSNLFTPLLRSPNQCNARSLRWECFSAFIILGRRPMLSSFHRCCVVLCWLAWCCSAPQPTKIRVCRRKNAKTKQRRRLLNWPAKPGDKNSQTLESCRRRWWRTTAKTKTKRREEAFVSRPPALRWLNVSCVFSEKPDFRRVHTANC